MESDNSIDRLAALQEVDRQLRDKALEIERLEQEVALCEADVKQQREAPEALRAEKDGLETHRRDLEAALEDEEQKMTDRRMRLNRVRNEKELQALRREIELGKEANQQREEEILRVMEALEALQLKSSDADQAHDESQAKSIERLEGHRARISMLKIELETARGARGGMVDGLSPSILRRYEQIFERRGGIAVVEVRNGTCLGCFMNLPPQFYNELQRARDIRGCPNCHRLLVWRATA